MSTTTGSPEAPDLSSPGDPLGAVRTLALYELELLDRTDRSQPSGEDRYGVDIFRISPTADGGYFALLRQRSELLLLDSEFEVLDRISTPRGPTGWTSAGRHLLVCGEGSGELQVVEHEGDELIESARGPLSGIHSLRELEFVEELDTLFALDGLEHRLIEIPLPAKPSSLTSEQIARARTTIHPICRGPLDLRYANNTLFVIGYLDHALWAIPIVDGQLTPSRKSVITHDGPIWSIDVLPDESGHQIVLGGVENRPLDRTGGEFGWVDSFAFLYEYIAGESDDRTQSLHRVAATNLSSFGIVTPKRIRLEQTGTGVEAWIVGFGSERGGKFSLARTGFTAETVFAVPPGVTDFTLCDAVADQASMWTVSPILDCIHEIPTVQGVPDPMVRARFGDSNQDAEFVLGQVLAWTTLMTPQNRTKGELSRFTCETCHFEGGIDGRVHFTGRSDIFATTRPIRGLANNVPVFSRAGDSTLATMVLSEFIVANQSREDRFTLRAKDHPWMTELGLPLEVDPEMQRRALLRFLVDLDHSPNPLRTSVPTDRNRPGLELFRDRCAGCHLPVESTRNELALVPFESWANRLRGEGRELIWGSSRLMRTGIEPYVSPAGARVPSLRRIQRKYPLFTNGSAQDLRELLERFRYQGFRGWHGETSFDPNLAEPRALTTEEIGELLKVLEQM